MLPRRKTGSLITAFGFIFLFWYFYNAQSVSEPPLENQRESTSLEEAAGKPAGQAPLLVPTSNVESIPHIPKGSKLPEKHPVTSYIPLPTGTPAKIPKLQHDFAEESPADKKERLERQAAVKASFVHSWEGYKKHAWLKDEVTPLKPGFVQSFGGWAATLVDTLDTLWMMGMKDEFEHALESLDKIDFGTTDSDMINIFETTIRYMGGFLGAYDISDGKYPKLLQKATEVGNLVYGAFDTSNRMPVTRWRWKDRLSGIKQEAGENSLIAELGSLTLEFTRLSQLTSDPKFFDAIQRITNVLHDVQPKTHIPGLWPTLANARFLTFRDTGFTLGGMADSTYEYLPKQHLLLGGLTDQYQKMYDAALEPIKEHIFFRPMLPGNPDILVSGGARASPKEGSAARVYSQSKGQHLGCFTGGMVGIGAKMFSQPSDMAIARKLVDGCIWAYNATQTGIMPEVFWMVPCTGSDPAHNCTWDLQAYHAAVLAEQANDAKSQKIDDRTARAEYLIKERRLPLGFTDIPDRRYILRPEAIESVFILYRLTGEKKYADAAWDMFRAIEKATRTDIANAAIVDMTVSPNPEKDNRMESFWLAETLKYFYAVFSEPGVLDLDRFVL
ncbi:MAG: hypothetical protein Q9191_000831 [Dirinaria sp. TL-2023a]